MAIPDFQTIMLPLMQYCEDGKEHSISETVDALSVQFTLTEEERKALLPSGVQEVFRNRVAWAKSHLRRVCWPTLVVESTKSRNGSGAT